MAWQPTIYSPHTVKKYLYFNYNHSIQILNVLYFYILWWLFMNLMLIANLHTDLTNSHLQKPLCAFLEITKSQQDVENIHIE